MALSEINHYRIIGKLGAGGMGEVFLAEDSKLGRKVAIKMLSERWAGDAQARQRLINEAKAAAALDHPNIFSFYEVGEDNGRVFIAMQYIEGRSLAQKIQQNPLPPSEVVAIGIQAAEALAEAHSRGIIHRDIKPQNIIITSRGQLKVRAPSPRRRRHSRCLPPPVSWNPSGGHGWLRPDRSCVPAINQPRPNTPPAPSPGGRLLNHVGAPTTTERMSVAPTSRFA